MVPAHANPPIHEILRLALVVGSVDQQFIELSATKPTCLAWNPQGTGKGTGTSTWYDATGKLALLWVPCQNEIDLLTECLICFHDRFYTIDEISAIIAVKSNQHEFTILQYDGEKHCVTQTETLAIMAELAALFDREIPKSRSSGEVSYPTLRTGGPLQVGQPHVSEALQGLDSVETETGPRIIVGGDRVHADLALRSRLW